MRQKRYIDKLPKWTGVPSFTYAGVGSRKTPHDIQLLQNKLAEWLEKKGFTLFSGKALGSDKAFEGAAQPWEKDIDGNVIAWSEYTYKVTNKEIFVADNSTEFAENVAREVHPNPNLSGYPLKLHARNLFQVLGINLDAPVDFLICWTPRNKNGEDVVNYAQRDVTSGGTGQAISYASFLEIPVVNMSSDTWRDELTQILLNLKNNTKN